MRLFPNPAQALRSHHSSHERPRAEPPLHRLGQSFWVSTLSIGERLESRGRVVTAVPFWSALGFTAVEFATRVALNLPHSGIPEHPQRR